MFLLADGPFHDCLPSQSPSACMTSATLCLIVGWSPEAPVAERKGEVAKMQRPRDRGRSETEGGTSQGSEPEGPATLGLGACQRAATRVSQYFMSLGSLFGRKDEFSC